MKLDGGAILFYYIIGYCYDEGDGHMEFAVFIKSSEQAQKLSRIAEKFEFDVWIHGNSGRADAKSLLGLMLLTIENDVKIVVADGIDTTALEKEIEEFRV